MTVPNQGVNAHNLAASVRARLLNHARTTGQDFNLVLTRYAIERLLYRISISDYSSQFLLKGGLLFDLWFDVPHRPTRDIDLLSISVAERRSIKKIFLDLCLIETADGVTFHPETIQTTEIRKDANYTGIRVKLLSLIGDARCPIQIDIGFGDAVTPDPEEANYPVMLPTFAAPRLRVYPRYAVVAEKLEALCVLGIANSRMKDYFDLWTLSCYADFDGEILRAAIHATFTRRRTPLPKTIPFGLSREFAQDKHKQTQWKAFLKKNALAELQLSQVVTDIQAFLAPPISALWQDTKLAQKWVPEKGWN